MPKKEEQENEVQGWIILILGALGFIILLALALLKVFIIITIVLAIIELVLIIIYLITKDENLLEPIKWGGIILLVSLVIVFVLYLIGVVFGNTQLGQMSVNFFQSLVNISKPISLN